VEDLAEHYVHGNKVGGVDKLCSWEKSKAAEGNDDTPRGADFAVGIISAIGNFERREAIRETWLAHGELEGFREGGRRWEYAFFLGVEEGGGVPREVMEEVSARSEATREKGSLVVQLQF